MSDLLLEPAYGKDLKCLAGDCPENCCMEWIIDIDDATAAYYRTVPGEFGEELRTWMRMGGKPLTEAEIKTPATAEAAIDPTEAQPGTDTASGAEPGSEAPQAAAGAPAPDGRDVLDESGLFTGTSSTTFALNGKNCPYLQEDGLCRLRLTLGYEHTSETCREHPFNTEEYDGFAERSPSVSCPEVVRLVFETPVNETYPDAPTDSSDSVLNILAQTRNAMLSAEAFDESLSLDVHILDLIRRVSLIQPGLNDAAPDYAFDFSDDIASQLISGFEEFRAVDETPLLLALQDFCLFLRENLSILTDRWKGELEGVQTKVFDCDCGMGGGSLADADDCAAAGTADSSSPASPCSFGHFLDSYAMELSRLYAYYIYRYFLKAVNDCAAPAWAGFAAAGAIIPAFLSWANGTSLKKTAAWYSREIEHDGENAEKILDFFRENLSEDWEDFT